MTKKSDNNPTTPKKQHLMKTRKDNKKEKKNKLYKKNQSSDDDGELPSEEELDVDFDFDLELPSDIEDDNSLNDKKYQKFLANMFPSTYMNKKVDALSSEDDDNRKPSKNKKFFDILSFPFIPRTIYCIITIFKSQVFLKICFY